MRYVFLCCCSLVVLLTGREALCVSSVSPDEEVQANFRQLMETNACPGCNLAGAVLNRLDLSEANLEGANLANAKFFLADLAGANLKNANLQGAALGGADLANADLQGANLTGAVLEGAYLKDAQMDGTVTIRRPYVDQGGPAAGETVYVDDEASSKNLPFTDKAYVTKTGQDEQAKVIDSPAVQEEKDNIPDDLPGESQMPEKIDVPQEKMTEPVHREAVEQSKKLVMMSDAVVPEALDADTMTGDKPVEEPQAESGESNVENLTPGGIEGADILPQETRGAEAVAESEPAAPSREEELMPEQPMAGSDIDRPRQEIERSANGTAEQSIDTGRGAGQAKTDESMAQLTEMGKETVVAEVTPPVVMPATQPVGGMEQQEALQQPEQMIQAGQQDESAAAVEEEVMAAGDNRQPAAEAALPEGELEVMAISAEPVMPAEKEAEVMESGPDEIKAKLVEKLLDENSCVECDLSGADLSGRNLDEADLERADLRNANLMGADLSEANLKGARLQGANLQNADLREADLYKADLRDADLTGARFDEALVDMVNFSGAVGADIEGARK